MEKLTEGKTKIIWPTANKDVVLIESKDDITAGDGVRHNVIEHKGVLATETTCNCFILLKEKGIPTHFIKRKGERSFLALKVKMIPIELVPRRIATGSYLKRHPEISEGTIFDPLIVEPFYKDDSLHDPIMVWCKKRRCFELYDAKKPLAKGYLFDLNPRTILTPQGQPFGEKEMEEIRDIAQNSFLILEEAWKKLNVELVDLKIECGWTQSKGLVVADVIDNDSWRIWPGGEKSQMKDKQVYRDLKDMTSETLGAIKKNYAWVAEVTRQFLR